MPSNPFPGMNPFLQEYWSDVHVSLLVGIRDALSEELPPDLLARAEEHVAVADTPRGSRPDVAVVESWRGGFPPLWKPADETAPSFTVTEPIVVLSEPEIERWIEIRDVSGELITVIEVLSPSNKVDPGWKEYRQKQERFLAAGVNLVEIDLIRGGHHALAVSLNAFRRPIGTSHLVCVARPLPGCSNRREVYPGPLREPLPTIRVPLRVGDSDVPLALQPLVDDCYRTGRYWLTDHERELEPPLSAEEKVWVEERLQAAGLR